MPLVKLNVPDPQMNRQEVLAGAARIVAEVTGKPLAVTQAVIAQADFMMGQEAGPGALVEVRGLGRFAPEVNAEISRRVCALLADLQGIPGKNIYLNFTGFEPANWGKEDGTY